MPPVSWKGVGLVVAIVLIAVGAFLYFGIPAMGPYAKMTQQAAAQAGSGNTTVTSPAPAPTQNPSTGGGSTGGSTGVPSGGGTGCLTGHICPNDILGGNPGPFDLGLVLAGVLILMAVVSAFFRGRWTTAKVIALVVVLVVGGIAIVAADEYASSIMLQFSSSSGTGNGTVPVQGSVFFSGAVGLANGGTDTVTSSQGLAAVAYNSVAVTSLAVRVDVILSCTNCTFNITGGYAALSANRVGAAGHADLRNTTYKPLGFAPGQSVNLYAQALNASQLEGPLGTIGCGLSADWNFTLLGRFTLVVTAGSQTVSRVVNFAWAGLELTRVGPACPSTPPGGTTSGLTSQQLRYRFSSFHQASWKW